MEELRNTYEVELIGLGGELGDQMCWVRGNQGNTRRSAGVNGRLAQSSCTQCFGNPEK